MRSSGQHGRCILSLIAPYFYPVTQPPVFISSRPELWGCLRNFTYDADWMNPPAQEPVWAAVVDKWKLGGRIRSELGGISERSCRPPALVNGAARNYPDDPGGLSGHEGRPVLPVLGPIGSTLGRSRSIRRRAPSRKGCDQCRSRKWGRWAPGTSLPKRRSELTFRHRAIIFLSCSPGPALSYRKAVVTLDAHSVG